MRWPAILPGVAFPFASSTRAAEYFAGSRGKGLQPRSLEVLDDFGVIDETLSSGRFHMPFRGYEGSKILGDVDPREGYVPTPDIPYASSLIIPQWRVEQILRNRLSTYGVQVELATELIGFEQYENAVNAILQHSGSQIEVKAQFLIGADGGHSLVRHKLGVGFEGETWTSERMFVGDVQADGLDRDHWHSWPSKEHGFVGLCPLPGTDSFQFQAQIGADETSDPSLERFQQILDERTGGMNIRLHDATWLSLYRANIRMVDRYRVGRVFLAGDAAHVHSPAGGQGMNTGIQDSYNLGWKLGQVLTGLPDSLLDTYEQERLPVAAWMLGVTSRLHREIKETEKAVRRGPETLQLGINYRDGRLAREERSNPGTIRAGDRTPDAPCHDSNGEVVRLFDVFRGPHFTMLAFGHGTGDICTAVQQNYGNQVRTCTIILPDAPPQPDSLVDTGGHAYRGYEAQEGSLVLVRPDGYIGLMTDSAGRGLAEYLMSVCHPGSQASAA